MRQPLCGRENARIQSKFVFGLAACIIAIAAIGATAQAQTLAALPFPSTVAPPGSSLVEMDLIEQPDGTLLRLTHTGFLYDEAAAKIREANNQFLSGEAAAYKA